MNQISKRAGTALLMLLLVLISSSNNLALATENLTSDIVSAKRAIYYPEPSDNSENSAINESAKLIKQPQFTQLLAAVEPGAINQTTCPDPIFSVPPTVVDQDSILALAAPTTGQPGSDTSASPLSLNGHLQSFSPPFKSVDSLTQQILQKEIDFFKINTYFRVENNKNIPNKRFHYLLYQNTNYACTMTGLLVNVIYNFVWYHRVGKKTIYGYNAVAQRVNSYTKKVKIPTAVQFGATMPRFVGKFILINGMLYEAVREMSAKEKEKRRGFNVAFTDKKVRSLQTEIQGLMQKRSNLLVTSAPNLTPAEQKSATTESMLLGKGLDLAVNEYQRCHVNSIVRSTYNRSDTVLSVLKKSDGDFGSDVTRLVGASIQNGALSPVASMSTTISGFMSAWDPIVELGARGIAKHNSRNTVEKLFGPTDKNSADQFERLLHDYDAESGNLGSAQSPLLASALQGRANIYHDLSSVYNDMGYVDQQAAADQKKHDKHSIIMHQIYGSSKYGRGAWLIYVGTHYNHANEHNTYLTGCAGIINFTGSAIRMCDTLHTDYIEFFHRKELKAKRSVSGTIINGRLNTLDDMTSNLASMHKTNL